MQGLLVVCEKLAAHESLRVRRFVLFLMLAADQGRGTEVLESRDLMLYGAAAYCGSRRIFREWGLWRLISEGIDWCETLLGPCFDPLSLTVPMDPLRTTYAGYHSITNIRCVG
jgi:hypothetical protein